MRHGYGPGCKAKGEINLGVIITSFILHLLIGLPSPSILTGSPLSYRGYTHRTMAIVMPQVLHIAQKQSPKDIQWFKDKMKISPKYVERRPGILGMSWGHFFTMVFLLLFAAGALIVFILRYKRTKEILKLIKEEAKNGSKG
ncbi:MAG: hypothetical protein DRG71_06275 [Deltaproteobacteria bacterium]|nr:MAG: hypothetical protein DRG71_06275 [Deltaproteobacteria bacterium]